MNEEEEKDLFQLTLNPFCATQTPHRFRVFTKVPDANATTGDTTAILAGRWRHVVMTLEPSGIDF